MREIWLVVVASILLSSCGKPEVQVCEDFLKKSLKSPSSYKLIKSTIVDEPLSLQQLKEDHVSPNPVDSEIAKQGKLGQRSVAIEYDASNSFGVALRGAMVCEFHTRYGKLSDKSLLELQASSSDTARTMRELANQGLLPNQPKMNLPEPKYPCCEN